MARKLRLILTGYPHHVVQRGHNRNTVFAATEDYQFYLENLRRWKSRLDIKVYSYCLMTNHIHLVLAPMREPQDVSMLMKRLAAKQTRFVNKIEGRSGTLWEGRFHCSPIQQDNYLLQCCRYVERNPVAAGIVEKPHQYEWSSYRAKAGIVDLGWLDLDPVYESLGSSSQSRRKNYTEFVSAVPSTREVDFIATSVSRNQLTGNNRFIEEIEARTGSRIEHRGQGRPTTK